MSKLIYFILWFCFAFLVLLLIYVVNKNSTKCENLRKIARNEHQVSRIITWYSSIMDSPEILEVKKRHGRYIYFSSNKNNFGLDLRTLAIPKDMAMFRFYGNNFSYDNFNSEDIEAVMIGSTMRDQLIFLVNPKSNFENRYIGTSGKKLEQLSTNIYLHCRS